MKLAGVRAGSGVRRDRAALVVALSASLLIWCTGPVVAYACPMCFTGNNSNQSAFLWGSLFLMFVPVTAIGGLLYWAYRRTRALEVRQGRRPPADREGGPDAADARARAALRLVRR